jgi:hypothetical protein
MAVYYATKAYVFSLTEALGNELAGTGVRATCLAPGPVKTEFFEQADVEHLLLVKFRPMEAERVARAGYRGFRAGKRIVVPGILNRLGAASVRFAPRRLVRRITARLNRPA